MANPLDLGDGTAEPFWILDNALLRFSIAVLSSIVVYVILVVSYIIFFRILEGNGDPINLSQVIFVTSMFVTPPIFLAGLPVAAALRAGGFRHWAVFAVLGTVASAYTMQWIALWWFDGDSPGWRLKPASLSGFAFGPPSALVWWWTWRLGWRRAAPEA